MFCSRCQQLPGPRRGRPPSFQEKRFSIIYLVSEVIPYPNSTIYKATDESNNRSVAVKEVNVSQYGGKWKRGELTRREFYAGKNLDHPNLPRYYECYDNADTETFSMCAIGRKASRSMTFSGTACD